MSEVNVWKGTPSQIDNLFVFCFLLVISALSWPLFSELLVWLSTKTYISYGIYKVILSLSIVFTVTPLLFIFWRWLSTRMTVTEITSQRIINRSGVLNRNVDEVELYRVKDYRIEKPLKLGMFGLSNIVMVTSDRLNPTITISAVRGGEKLRDAIRSVVESRRAEKGVREIDT